MPDTAEHREREPQAEGEGRQRSVQHAAPAGGSVAAAPPGSAAPAAEPSPQWPRPADEARRRPEPPSVQPPARPSAPAPAPAQPAAPPAESRPAAPHVPRHRRRLGRGLLRFLLMVVLPLVAVVYGALWWGHGQRFVSTENAYVKSNIIAIASELNGRVVEVDAQEHQPVKQGDILLRLDPRPFEIAVAGARADLAGVRAEIDALRAQYRSGIAADRELAQRVRYLEREFERQQQLAQRGVATQAKLDEATNALETARLLQRVQTEKNRVTLAELGGDVNIAVEQHPKYMHMQAKVDEAELNLSHTVIRSPADGIASNVRLQVGEYVKDEDPIFSVIESGATWIEANLKETQLTYLQRGQRATVVADAYPDTTFEATVCTISPATGAEFALLPPQNASGNWVKVVQRLPVRLCIEEQPGQPRLRAGMSVAVNVDTERDRSTRTLVRELLAWLGLDGVVPTSLLALLPGEAAGAAAR